MSYSQAESLVLARFQQKCRIAGGPKAGYNLRREAIGYALEEAELSTLTEGLDSLVERGLLASNESGDRFVLTEDGVAALSESA